MASLEANATALLNKRYLDNVVTTVDQLWDAVSGGNSDYRRLLSELKFLPNSPTLFNAGRRNGCTLSACFVFNVFDCMYSHNGVVREDSILRTREKAALVAKAGGGVGYWLSGLRRKNSLIQSVHRKACGPVAVIRDLHGLSKLLTQGGKRELAQLGILDCDHDDINEFIACKDEDPQSLSSFNISVGWKKSWFDDVMENGAGTFARELFQAQCRSAWRHGCPGVFFPDTVNRFNPNPHLGLMLAANPCGETPNRNDEACNLGSLVALRYFLPATRTIDWSALEDDARSMIRFLDDILDRNVFPHPAITEATLLTRKLGLGVMGWADLLAAMHIAYDSEEAVRLADKFWHFVSTIADDESRKLAKEKGPYPGYSDKTEGPCRRNETVTSIAPTGSISVLAGVKGWSIEPWYAEENDRVTSDGLRLHEDVPTWIRDALDGYTPKCAHEIAPEWHVRMQAAFQKHTDLGVSKTVNVPRETTSEQIGDIYKLMYRLGCKGGTVYRDGCRDEQVLTKTDRRTVYSLPAPVEQRRLPDDVDAKRHKFRVGSTEGFLIMGLYPDGKLGEIFIVSKNGTTISGLLDTWAITFSIALQNGVSVEKLCEHHVGNRFEPAGMTRNKDVPVATSVPDYVCRYLMKRFVGEKTNGKAKAVGSGQLCPDCGREAVIAKGCVSCPDPGCGWTRCG